MDPLGLGALGLVTAEWLAVGWLSSVEWPASPPAFWAPRWALRGLVGAGLVAVAQLALALVGVGFASLPLVLVVAAVGAGTTRLMRRRRLPNSEEGEAIGSRERVGWFVLGAVLIAAVIRALVVPEAGWDAYSHWGLRAEAYTLAGNVVNARSEHEYYPPLVPLLEAWLSLHRGQVSIDLAKTVWALLGSGFGVCLAWHLKLSLGRLSWLAPYAAAAIVASTTALLEGFWTGQADLALTAYLTSATLALWQWTRRADRRWLTQVAIFGLAAALTKLEGGPRIGVVVAALLLEGVLCRTTRLVLPAAVLSVAAIAGALLWGVTAARYGISPNTEHLGAFQPLTIGGVLLSLVAVFGGVRTGGALLVLTLGWILAAGRLPRLLVLVVLGQMVATLVAFLLSNVSPEVEVRTSATRLVEQVLPLALFTMAIGLPSPRHT